MLLQLRGRASASVLARELGVTIRTIYRDIDQLGEAGVPVYAEPGRAGGFALVDGYRTRLTGLSDREAEALLLGGVGRAAAELGMAPEAMAARLKMLASLPPGASASADRIATRFHLDPLGWYRRAESLESLPVLADAVWRDRRLNIRYESWTRRATQTIDPLGLVHKGGIWYLVAATRGRPRIYRASKISALRVLETPTRRPRNFDLAVFWSDAARAFETQMTSGRATIRISAQGRRLLRDLQPAMADAVDAANAPDARAGWRRAVVPIEASAFGVRQLMALGTEVEIVAPASLRELMAKQARAIARVHR